MGMKHALRFMSPTSAYKVHTYNVEKKNSFVPVTSHSLLNVLSYFLTSLSEEDAERGERCGGGEGGIKN